jgi:hypothetical protein
MDRSLSPSKKSILSSVFLRSVLLGGALCVMPGCFKVQALMPDTVPAERHTQWVNGFFWGAVGGTVDAARYCGGRPVASIETKRSVGNYLIELVTLGIYTPSHVAITCGQPRYPQYGAAYPAPVPAVPMYPNPYGY